MKMIIAKLKKLTIVKTISIITLSISLVFCNVIPVFASTAVDQESLYPILKTSGTSYLYPVTGNSKTVLRYTTITDLLAQYADQSTLNQKTTYTLLNGTFKGYIDGIETTLSTIDTKLGNISGYVDGVETSLTNINTNLTNIKSYVDGLEGYLDGVEGYIDGLETAFTTNNTRLNEIKSAIQNITTYNYTQVLSDILTNTGYLSTIDTYTQSIQDSIGYGTTGDNLQSKLSGISSYTSDTKDGVNDLNTFLSNRFGNKINIGNYTALNRTSFKNNVGVINVGSNRLPLIKWDNSGSAQGSYSIGIYPYINQDGVVGNIQAIMHNLFMLNSLIRTVSTIYNPSTYREGQEITLSGANQMLSIMDMMSYFGENISHNLGDLQFVLADSDTISAKQANKNQEQAVLTNFTGQGSASASANDFGDIASGVASVNSGLNTGVSISNIFNIYNNRDGYGFWSVETQNELNTTNASRSYKSNRCSDTPLYDSKLSEIYSFMGVNHD